MPALGRAAEDHSFINLRKHTSGLAILIRQLELITTTARFSSMRRTRCGAVGAPPSSSPAPSLSFKWARVDSDSLLASSSSSSFSACLCGMDETRNVSHVPKPMTMCWCQVQATHSRYLAAPQGSFLMSNWKREYRRRSLELLGWRTRTWR